MIYAYCQQYKKAGNIREGSEYVPTEHEDVANTSAVLGMRIASPHLPKVHLSILNNHLLAETRTTSSHGHDFNFN